MFTGIVEEVGSVDGLTPVGDGYELRIWASKVVEDVHLGDSIAVDGTCLTVTQFDSRGFSVGLSPETLHRTNLGGLTRADEVNLERALRPTDRLGGHYVQGHVDGVGTISQKRKEGDSLVMRIDVHPEIARYIVEKGFIAVDGVSLTVTGCGDSWFTVALIAYTQQAVTLPNKMIGDKVNLEVDIIGKYVESFLARREIRRGITEEMLAEEGFI